MARTGAFDRYSREYEQWFEKNSELYRLELEAVRELLPDSGIGLETGSGSGKFAVPLGVRLGIEPSEAMARIALERGVATAMGVAEHMPVRDSICDFVLMVTTVCFVDDILQTFAETRRILKPGGCIVTGLVDRESRLGQCYQERKDRSRFYKEATFYSAEEIMHYLVKAGFKKFETRQTLIEDKNQVLTEKILPGTGTGAFVVIKAVSEAN